MRKRLAIAEPAKYLEDCKELPDVTFIVEKVKVPAHRQILSERSEYFRTMFDGRFNEAKLDEIVLKDTKLIPFTRVLFYIYNNSLGYLYKGKIYLPEIFDVLKCAQYYMIDDLELKLLSKLKGSCIYTDRLILLLRKTAIDYEVDELVLYCADLILDPDYGYGYGYGYGPRLFDELSPTAVDYFLQMHLDVPESLVFEELVYWMRRNPESKSTFPRMLEHIELHLLDNKHFSMLFEPTRLVNRRFFENVLSQQREQAKMVQKVENRNVVDGVRLVQGNRISSENILKPLNKDETITVDLKKPFLLNCLKLKLNRHIPYAVLVSVDMRNWEQIIDYSKYDCFGQQVLYFNERIVRFIRIECKAYNWAIDADIAAFYSTDLREIDLASTVSVPKHDLIPTTMMYRCKKAERKWSTREITYVKDKNGDFIMYQFSQPYIIGSMKLLLNEKCSYSIETSTDEQCWKRVFLEQNVSGWRSATFKKRAVMFILIKGTKAFNGDFHLYKMECPAN